MSEEKQPEKLTRAHFDVEKLLGTGSYSEVYLARRWADNKHYAMKIVNKAKVTRNKMFIYILNEKKILNMLNHPNIIQLYWTFKDSVEVYLVSEYCRGGELWELIQNHGKLHFKLAQLYTAYIISALEHMHSLNICHRDLKPENILLDENRRLKVADLGTSREYVASQSGPDSKWEGEDIVLHPIFGEHEDIVHSDDDTGYHSSDDEGKTDEEKYQDESSAVNEPWRHDPRYPRRKVSFVGTPEYMAAEVLHNLKSKGTAADLWSLGCIVYQMLVGHPPIQGPSPYLTFQRTIKMNFSFPGQNKYKGKFVLEDVPGSETGEKKKTWTISDPDFRLDDVSVDLIRRLLRTNPYERLGAGPNGYDRLKAHPFFEGIDWDNLQTISVPPLSFSSNSDSKHSDNKDSKDPKDHKDSKAETSNSITPAATTIDPSPKPDQACDLPQPAGQEPVRTHEIDLPEIQLLERKMSGASISNDSSAQSNVNQADNTDNVKEKSTTVNPQNKSLYIGDEVPQLVTKIDENLFK